MSAAWSSQTFPPEGASAAEGVRNQLGRPELDLLTILVREAAQNSWDARRTDVPSVDFRLSIGAVSAAHLATWRDLLLRNAPLDGDLPLRRILRKSDIRTLSVSDRGTSGLGGPTRADVLHGDNHDFISFVRNIGEPRDKEFGGGTYGFGKGILSVVDRRHRPATHPVRRRERTSADATDRLRPLEELCRQGRDSRPTVYRSTLVGGRER